MPPKVGQVWISRDRAVLLSFRIVSIASSRIEIFWLQYPGRLKGQYDAYRNPTDELFTKHYRLSEASSVEAMIELYGY